MLLLLHIVLIDFLKKYYTIILNTGFAFNKEMYVILLLMMFKRFQMPKTYYTLEVAKRNNIQFDDMIFEMNYIQNNSEFCSDYNIIY